MFKFEQSRPIRDGARPSVLESIFRGRGISNIFLKFSYFWHVLTHQKCDECTSIAICDQNGIEWAFWAETHTAVHIMGWRMLAEFTTLPTWLCLCTISNLTDTVRGSLYRYILWVLIDSKSWGKMFRKFQKFMTISPLLFSLVRPWFSTFWFRDLTCYRPICWKPQTVYPMQIGQKTCPQSSFKIFPNFDSFWSPNGVFLVKNQILWSYLKDLIMSRRIVFVASKSDQ